MKSTFFLQRTFKGLVFLLLLLVLCPIWLQANTERTALVLKTNILAKLDRQPLALLVNPRAGGVQNKTTAYNITPRSTPKTQDTRAPSLQPTNPSKDITFQGRSPVYLSPEDATLGRWNGGEGQGELFLSRLPQKELLK